MKKVSASTAVIYLTLSLLFILYSPLYSYSQSVKTKFELKGKINGVTNGIIYLGYYINKEKKVINDSSIIVDGVFTFKGNISEPTVAFISLYKDAPIGVNSTNIFLEPSLMNISLELNKFSEAHLTGSNTEKEYEDLQALGIPIKENYKLQLKELSNDQLAGDKDSLLILLKPLFDQLNQNDYEFFDSHPKSYVTAYLLQYHIRDLSIDSLTLFYGRLGNDLQHNIITEHVSDKLSRIKVGAIGSMAKPFSSFDVNGDYINSRFSFGNYILLDFWASWCVPCRKNSPHLIDLYKLYKSKGLRIIGIASNDNDTSSWRKAIETDGTGIWTQVLRGSNKEAKLKGLKNESDINEKYGVDQLPTIILINPDGIIIGRYEEEFADLDKKLATIFK